MIQEIRNAPPTSARALNAEEFRRHVHLFTSGSPALADELLQDIERGCLLGLKPGCDSRRLSRKPAHFFRSLREAAFILDTFIKEAKAAVLVPSKLQPLYFINFFSVPKRASDGTMSALRAIRNAKYRAAGTYSLNEFIADEAWRIRTLPKLTTYGELLVDKEYLALRDLSDAFRQLVLALEDQKYCGYSLFGQWWLDTRVAYGISSSAASCQRFVELICRIFNKVSLNPRFQRAGAPDIRHCYKQILAYIDDFLLAAKDPADCREMERRFDALLQVLGVKQSRSKVVRCCTRAVVYGWEWDLAAVPKTLAIPIDRLARLRWAILACLKYRIVSLKVVKRINGKLMHYAQIRREAKAFVWNSMFAMRRFCRRRGAGNSLYMLLTPDILRCWMLWYKFSEHFRIAPIASLLYRPSISVSAVTDASTSRGGYVLGSHWASYAFQHDMLHLPICAKEAHVIVTMLVTHRAMLTGRRVRIYCDNKNVVCALVRRWSSSPVLFMFVLELVMYMIEFKIQLWVEWLSTHCNVLADALSRNKLRLFFRVARTTGVSLDKSRTRVVYPTEFRFPFVSRQDDEAEYRRFCAWARAAPGSREPRWWCQSLDATFRAFFPDSV